MTRYKGRTSPEAVERDFPHHVEMIVPLGGFGKKLDVMHEWHSARGIEAMHGRGRRDEKGRNYIRWCFSGPTGVEVQSGRLAVIQQHQRFQIAKTKICRIADVVRLTVNVRVMSSVCLINVNGEDQKRLEIS
jgi:hypothetical protein